MELPDIELAKRSLSRTGIYHSPIKKTSIRDKKVAHDISPATLKGQKVQRLHRKGKFLIMELEKGCLLFHGGMTGKFAVFPEDKELEHTALKLEFGNGTHFSFQNPRRFGECYYCEDWRKRLSDLGLDPLSKKYTFKAFKEALNGHSGSIKPFLQKQEYIAGMGNIYIDETLWEAKIHPLLQVDSLRAGELKRLYNAIPRVCQWAIRNLKPPVATRSHQIGDQPDFLKVYGREGEPCIRCKNKIEKAHISQRVTFYCPNCQKK